MSIHRDYEEFFACLNAHRVRYLIVGGYAVGFHARPRWTKNMDIWVEAEASNAQRVAEALSDFFGSGFDVTVEDLTDEDGR